MIVHFKTVYDKLRHEERGDFLSPRHKKIFGAVTRIRANVMSGPIRKLIGPAKIRLQRYIEEAFSLLSSGVEERTLEDDEIRVEEVIARINTHVSLLEHCNCDWSGLLKDLKNEERSKEEKEYQRVAEGSEGYIELLMDTNEMVACLQSWLKLIARARA